MILAYINTDKTKVEQKNKLMFDYKKTIGNLCKHYSPIYFDHKNKYYFIIIKEEHKNVLGLKTYNPIDVTDYFQQTQI